LLLNSQEFSEKIILPNADKLNFPNGFGQILTPQNLDLDFEKWIDTDIDQIITHVRNHGFIVLESYDKDLECSFLRPNTITHSKNQTLPWHEDGQNGQAIIFLAQSPGSKARSMATSMAPTATLLTTTLRAIPDEFMFANIPKSTQEIFIKAFNKQHPEQIRQLYAHYAVSDHQTQSYLDKFWDKVNNSIPHAVYHHNWERNPNSVLMVDTMLDPNYFDFTKTLHARFCPEEGITGGNLSWGSISTAEVRAWEKL